MIGTENGAGSETVSVREDGIYPDRGCEDREKETEIERGSGSGSVCLEEAGVGGVIGEAPGVAQIQMGLAIGDWWKGWDCDRVQYTVDSVTVFLPDLGAVFMHSRTWCVGLVRCS